MKKISTFVLLCLFSFNAYSFWIWSPKTLKWKNPKYSALATPFLQYKEAVKYFEKKEYRKAAQEFRKVLIHYPDSEDAADAQYYLGRCLEETNKPYQAFLEYEKVTGSYPNSKRINEVIEREYNIGEYFLNREPKKWMGVSVYDFVDHPSIEIFKKIVEKSPYSKYASQAQYKMGMLMLQLGRYEEACDAFQKVIDNYPDSEWASPAKYQLAIATAKGFSGTAYDSYSLEEATKRLDEFVKEHPEAEISPKAIGQLADLRDKEAKKSFDTAHFYETQKKYNSAAVYYQIVIDRYPESQYVQEAKKKIAGLKEK